jgi:SAM-dependent methyltransferase
VPPTTVPPLTLHAWLRFDLVRRMLPDDARTVLEIGAGQGSVGSELADRYDYLGVEPDPSSFAVAAQRIGDRGRVLNTTLENLPVDRTFDLVCAFEVLEHIEDDNGALAAWIERVTPGGRLLLSVPAGPKRFGASDEMVGHFRRYDRDGLGDLLAAGGLGEIDVRTYGFPLGYALEVVRNQIVKRAAGRGSRAERTAASGRLYQPSGRAALVAAAAATPFRIVQAPFSRTGLGTGLVALARRAA